MTTAKPKAKKFRIRRNGSLSGAQTEQPVEQDVRPEGASQGVVTGEVSSAREISTEDEIAAIRKEKLTGRQLRMARRVAQKHGLSPTSDFDAIRLLRAKGIDPFQRSNMLELVVDEGQKAGAQLPQTVPQPGEQLPSTEVLTEDNRAQEIRKMQRDIVRRRRRKLTLLLARLSFFVFLPTILAGYYFYAVATPMYSTVSQFVIQKGDSPAAGAAGGLGGALAGTGLASSQDSVVVQGYLQSRAAMDRLDKDHGFKAHYSQDWIDPIQKLDADATNEKAYSLYQKEVLISYDPSEGVIKMEVITADPEKGMEFSNSLISYAEEQVDNLTARKREEAMKGALESFDDAVLARKEAQAKMLEVQQRTGAIDITVPVGQITAEISALKTLLLTDQLSLEEMQSNARPNLAKMRPLERRIATLTRKIQEAQDKLTKGSAGNSSVAETSAELLSASSDLEVRTLMMQSALQAMETSRVEASRQTRFLSLAVPPVQADAAKYPRKFENTILALLIFSGIYLMMSLTSSILREQVAS